MTARPVPKSSQSQVRAKALPISAPHIRSVVKRTAREESRECLLELMGIYDVSIADIAEALGIDERGASRAVRGERPIDYGEWRRIGRHSKACALLALAVLHDVERDVVGGYSGNERAY